MVVVMLLEEEATLVDESARLDTMRMSNKCSSSKNMSSNRCDGLSENNLNTLKVVVMVVAWVEDQPLGRVCMMMFRNPMLVEMAMAADVVDSRVERVMEATEDQLHHRLDLRVLLRQTLLLDRRMLASRVRIIVVVVGVASVVSTLMPEDE